MIEHESRPNGPRRLERSRDDRAVAGVCAGVARYLGVDATVVRVVTVALLAFGGFGAFLYLAAWLLVPEQGAERPLLGPIDQRRTVQVAAIVVLAIACVALLGTWWDVGFWFGGGPLFLVVCAAAVLWFVSERRRDDEPVAAYMASATATAPTPTPGASAGAPAGSGVGGDGSNGDDDATLVQEPSDPAPRPPRRRGSWGLTAIAVGGVMVALGAAAALDAAGLFDLGWGGFVALAIVLTGVALVATAFYGGARLLIPVGLLLALFLGGAVAAGVSLSGGVGQRDYRVTDGDLLRGRYELGIGHLQLDLRDIELARGVTHVDAELGAGFIEIVAPNGRFANDDLTVADSDDEGRGDGGVDTSKTIVVGSGDRRLEIDAHVGAGVIAITTHPGAEGDWEWSGRCPGTTPGLGLAGLRPTCEGDRDEA